MPLASVSRFAESGFLLNRSKLNRVLSRRDPIDFRVARIIGKGPGRPALSKTETAFLQRRAANKPAFSSAGLF